MNEIYLQQYGKSFRWTLRSKNGRDLAYSNPYKTKFHCKMSVLKSIRKPYRIVDEVQDRRERA